MATDSDSAGFGEGFLRMAQALGLDVSDEERGKDLARRVALMREGLARLYEIDVSDAESPSAFIPSTHEASSSGAGRG
ncbi:MAG: hypothetical protein OXL37_06900 [Chloroflexota bacterium]|nr:hypothetical protein [Chloroflexota bacterium]MDE2961903.1 hypothetical protein [Chloroflexota bacterium]